MKPFLISVAVLVVSLFLAPTLLAQSPDAANLSPASPADVPRLIKFSGALLDAQEKPLTGPAGVTFALYAQHTGGAALWMETQNVKPDASGNYTVLLGANSAHGVPAELFFSGEARWLGIQVGQQPEHERILLVSVPYALKAGDAETLGGLPASAFVTTQGQSGAGNSAGTASPTSPASTARTSAQTTPNKALSTPQAVTPCSNVSSDGAATVNSIGLFTTPCNMESSLMSQATVNGFPSINLAGNNAGLLLNGTGTHQVTVTGATSGRLGQDAGGFFFASDTKGAAVRFLTNNGTLNERMRITSAGNVGIGTATPLSALDVNGTVTAASYNGALILQPSVTDPSQGFVSANVVAGYMGATGGNTIAAGVTGATISGGGGLAVGSAAEANTVTTDWGTIGGGYGNKAGNGPGIAGPTVGGGFNNTASGNLSTVGGGTTNTASGKLSTVGGGNNNGATSEGDTVAGGESNTASGVLATVAGGQSNTASGAFSTVGGGQANTASGLSSTVAGGASNAAIGYASIVAGGVFNTARGDNSFAAGCRANAMAQGTFVWSGNLSGCTSVSANAVGEFVALAPGGVTFYSNNSLTAGVALAAGGSSWKMVSDRNLKRDFASLDENELLAKINRIPMSTWSYKSQDPSIRHMGPMAQDFYAAFHLGEDDKHIEEIDGQGVALAGVQALYRLSLEEDRIIRSQQTEIQKLRAEVRELRRQQTSLASMEARLERLEARERSTHSASTRSGAALKKGAQTEAARLSH